MIMKLEAHIVKREPRPGRMGDLNGRELFSGDYDFDFVAFPQKNERHTATIAAHTDKTYLTPPDIFISAEGGIELILQRGETLP